MSTSQKPAYRQWIGYQAMLLGGFSILAAALLIIGNIATRDVILERQQEDLQNSLRQVMPADQYDNNLLENPLQLNNSQGKPLIIYRGTKDMQVSALAWETSGPGYAGEIRLILGLDAGGHILGARVLSHTETPGLGDKIEAEKNDWILTFNGLSFEHPATHQWKVKKDGGQFDQFSGATITPRSVVQIIKEGLAFFEAHRTELLNPPIINTTTATQE